MDNVSGGKGDKTTIADVNKKEFVVGFLVEREHTDKASIAKEIALDHLTEDPEYYSKLYKAGILDEPNAIKMAKKWFGEVNVTEWLHTEIKNILSEYEWGDPAEFWKGQLAGEAVSTKQPEEPAIVMNKSTKQFYLASVSTKTKRIMEIHPMTKSKTADDVCRMKWIKLYKQIHELTNEGWKIDDYKWISNPIQSCKR
jgi:hypothetical protein